MKSKSSITFFISILMFSTFSCRHEDNFTVNKAQECLELAMIQYEGMYNTYSDRATYPRNIEKTGKTRFVNPRDWTSGFYPGSLWYLYEYSGNEKFKNMAQKSTAGLEKLKSHQSTHDLGFMMYCSFGNGLRLTKHPEYKDILINGAYSLASRYDSLIGCIKSWDGQSQWQYPVIIDNMMNLELIFWAAKVSNDSLLYDLAISHANTTLKNHFRSDNSSYHVVDYDTISGQARWKGTHQGFGKETSWARGQAWGLYGYTMCYRESKNSRYLEQAQKIANFILSNPNLAKDFIPFWDFNSPDIPNTERDASSAAIIASALMELSQYVDETAKKNYLGTAEKILTSLSSSDYLAEPGLNNYFILKHSVGHMPNNSEIDTPIIYADYYFIEAVMRFININKRKGTLATIGR